MNGYELTKKMREAREQYRLNAIEQVIYHELVSVCNELKWPILFYCTNTKLCDPLGISVATLIRARKKLQQTGLIFYWSEKKRRAPGYYTFISPEELVNNPGLFANETNIPLTIKELQLFANEANNIINSNKTINTPHNPPGGEVEHKQCIPFDKIKELLLGDQTWKEQIAMHSGLSIKFLDILPGQIDIFLNYIIATGGAHTVLTLSKAKKRFFWWWKSQGIKEYEASTQDPETIIW